MPDKHLIFKNITCYGAEWHLDWHQTLLIQNPAQRTRVYMIDNSIQISNAEQYNSCSTSNAHYWNEDQQNTPSCLVLVTLFVAAWATELALGMTQNPCF